MNSRKSNLEKNHMNINNSSNYISTSTSRSIEEEASTSIRTNTEGSSGLFSNGVSIRQSLNSTQHELTQTISRLQQGRYNHLGRPLINLCARQRNQFDFGGRNIEQDARAYMDSDQISPNLKPNPESTELNFEVVSEASGTRSRPGEHRVQRGQLLRPMDLADYEGVDNSNVEYLYRSDLPGQTIRMPFQSTRPPIHQNQSTEEENIQARTIREDINSNTLSSSGTRPPGRQSNRPTNTQQRTTSIRSEDTSGSNFLPNVFGAAEERPPGRQSNRPSNTQQQTTSISSENTSDSNFLPNILGAAGARPPGRQSNRPSDI